MDRKLAASAVSRAVAAAENSLAHADRITWNWDIEHHDRVEDKAASFYIEEAFIQTLTLMEAAGLTETYKALAAIKTGAAKNYTALDMAEDTFLLWGAKLRQYLHAVRNAIGEPKTSTVTKPVIDILKASQYSITDQRVFGFTPRDEADVHMRIEAVLKCIFPDLKHKPTITKPIKNFEPDTGLPSVRTLVEYKFISSLADAKRVADEVLADTRGYASREWDFFVYVVYETKRFWAESVWDLLLRDSGVSPNASIVVISGEEPRIKRSRTSSNQSRSGPKRRLRNEGSS